MTQNTQTRDFNFADQLLTWFDQHGRKDLPWHHPRTAYHVWVSEIMLQQTQVKTVIPYYLRFMQRFTSLADLANASQDEVLSYWSGLGYYARGRNLHKAAQVIQAEHDGVFPQNFDQVLALPGIGRSTAAAILAQAFGQRYPILDGNVKRVLARFYAIDGWPGERLVENQLWVLAHELLPFERLADYTQAQMDLGAMLCKRRRPLCEECPLSSRCLAFQQGLTEQLPKPKPKKVRPTKPLWVLILSDAQGRIALCKRPARGIWGGLYSLPEFDSKNQALLSGVKLDSLLEWPLLQHSFSHYHLQLWPLVAEYQPSVQEELASQYIWFEPEQALQLGLPAPIYQLVKKRFE